MAKTCIDSVFWWINLFLVRMLELWFKTRFVNLTVILYMKGRHGILFNARNAFSRLLFYLSRFNMELMLPPPALSIKIIHEWTYDAMIYRTWNGINYVHVVSSALCHIWNCDFVVALFLGTPWWCSISSKKVRRTIREKRCALGRTWFWDELHMHIHIADVILMLTSLFLPW